MCSLVNAWSDLLLAGPVVRAHLKQPHFCWTAGFGLLLLLSSDISQDSSLDKMEEFSLFQIACLCI